MHTNFERLLKMEWYEFLRFKKGRACLKLLGAVSQLAGEMLGWVQENPLGRISRSLCRVCFFAHKCAFFAIPQANNFG